jgi:hypothetical protein
MWVVPRRRRVWASASGGAAWLWGGLLRESASLAMRESALLAMRGWVWFVMWLERRQWFASSSWCV